MANNLYHGNQEISNLRDLNDGIMLDLLFLQIPSNHYNLPKNHYTFFQDC